MANTIEIVIKATDSASQVISKVESNVSGSTQKIVKNFDEVGKASQTAQQKIQDFGAGMAGLGDKLSIGVTLPLVAAGTAAIKFASDLNETTSKIGVLFGDMSADIKQWADTAATSFGLSKKAALDGAADFAIFGKAAGLAGQDLTEFSKQNVKLASDMASFFNTSPEEAITAIGAAFRGESEPIRRYGVLINDVALKDEALRQGLIKTTTDALTPQQRILAASALIMKQTSAAQGDFARTSDQLANSTRIAKAQLEDAAAMLGTNLLPLVNKGINFVNGLLKAFQDLSPEMQNTILAFGGIAAAMGPVMSVGGRLVGVFAALAPKAIDAAGSMATMVKSVIGVADSLHRVGVTSYTVEDALIRLRASGALLTGELALIVAGLIAIAKYLEQVDAASKATNEDLIKMSRSGDIFKQAAASTEIMINGQDRLKVALDGTAEKIRTGAKDYADYKSSLEATAKAAGYQIDAQGNLVKVTYGAAGAVIKLVQANYELSKAQYEAIPGTGQLGVVIEKLADKGRDLLNIIAPLKDEVDKLSSATQSGIAITEHASDVAAKNAIAMGVTTESIKAQKSAMADAYSMAITYTESQRKQADVQAELDKLNQQIAAHGAVRIVTIQNEKLSTEELARAQLQLAASQEDLATAQKKGSETDAEFALRVDTIKGKIADYSAKLGEHTAVVGGATKAEQEQKKALEEQIATLQKTDEINRAKGAFESLTKAFRDGILTQDQYQARAAALNSISGLYTASALQQATAQEVLMKSFADPASEAWRSQLILNKAAIDGQVESTNKAVEATDALNKKQTEAPPPRAVAKAEEVDMGGKKYSASVEAAQAHLDFIRANEASAASAKKAIEDVSAAQETAAARSRGATDVIVGGYGAVNVAIDATRQRNAEMSDAAIKAAQDRSAADEAASREMKGNAEKVAGAYKNISKTIAPPVVTPKIDTTTAAKDIQAFTTDKVGAIPKEKTTVIKADTVAATKNTNDILKLFGVIPDKKLTTVDVDGKQALQTTDDIIRELEKIIDKVITITVKYKTEGPPPAGLQFGGSLIVPPNPMGGMGDYFPILAAPGERVTVQTRAQQAAGSTPSVIGGDTYIYNTNVYNPLAAAMLADKQRRDRLARSNARMGVQA